MIKSIMAMHPHINKYFYCDDAKAIKQRSNNILDYIHRIILVEYGIVVKHINFFLLPFIIS